MEPGAAGGAARQGDAASESDAGYLAKPSPLVGEGRVGGREAALSEDI